MIFNTQNILKKHIVIIVVLAGALTLAMQFNLTRAILYNGYLHADDIVTGRADRAYYLVLINESSKGNWSLGNPYFKEWNQKPYLYPSLNINAPGFIQKTLHLDARSMLIAMDYGALFVLMVSALIAFAVLFRGSYFGYLVALVYLLLPRMLIWDRTVSPQLNFIPLFIFLAFYFSEIKFWKRELGLGFFLGIMFYTYPYHWTFGLVLVALSDIWRIMQERKNILKNFLKYFVTVALLPLYLVHTWHMYKLPYYAESIKRIGVLYSRFPAGYYTQAGLIFLFFLYFLLKKYVFSKNKTLVIDKDRMYKILIGMAASLTVLNQQLITGAQLESNSHYLPVILIFMISFIGFLVLSFYSRTKRFKIFISTAGVILVFVLFGNALYYWIHNDPYIVSQNYLTPAAKETLGWFKQNNIQDIVVYAPPDLGDKILLLTNNYLFFHDTAELQLMPTKELIDRFTYFDITNSATTAHLPLYQLGIFGQTFNSGREKSNVLGKIKALLLGRQFVPETLDTYLAYDYTQMYKTRTNPNINKFINALDRYHVSYMIYSIKDKNSIYRKAPGRIVFENSAYLVKAR